MSTNEEQELTTAAALQEWRAAEQVAAVSRRGRVAAEAAAAVAGQAAEAALATAASAKVALEAATLAEASAVRTAEAARALVKVSGADAQDAADQSISADAAEGEAKDRYGAAVARAQERSRTPTG